MAQTVYYCIAQHIPDPFRQEQRNLGVFVRKGSLVRAKFIGETGPGQFDKRRLRGFQYPEVYIQWIDYWRSLLDSENPIAELVQTSGANYRVIEGGEVTDAGEDALDDVLNYLYSLLVSEGGFREALGGLEEDASTRLTDAISTALESAKILAVRGSPLPEVPHPVETNAEVTGAIQVAHRPSFIQRNGKLYVMESVDFTARDKERARDHAGLASFMFEDLKKEFGDKVHTIAIVQYRPEDKQDSEPVRYGLSILQSESNELTEWFNPEEQKRFIDTRKRIALISGH